MMTTARAARSATPSVALVPRKAAARRKAVLQEEEAQEVALQEAVPQEARHQETQVVVAVAPAATRMTTIHRAVVAEAVADSLLWDTLRVEIYQKS